MDEYGLIGYPLSHSFSAAFFADKFEKENIVDTVYKAFPLEKLSDFPALIQSRPNLRGLNVTLPFKQSIIPYLDVLSPIAQDCGAVNTIKIIRSILSDGKEKITYYGHNTDSIGFIKSMETYIPALKFPSGSESNPENLKSLDEHDQKEALEIQNAYILGTGGAARAVFHSLNNHFGIHCIVIGRSRPSWLQEQEAFLHYDQLDQKRIQENNIQLLVQCTPLGTYPHIDACLDIPYDKLPKKALAYDLVYNPNPSLFLQKCKQRGLIIQGGDIMLREQALASWSYWKQSEQVC